MRIAIFGGAGFVGRPLVKALLDKGHEVVVVDNLSVKPEGEVDDRAHFLKVNVTSVSGVSEALENRPEIICWLAAKQGYRSYYSKYAKTNVVGAHCLFEVLTSMPTYKPKRILLASSQAVYVPGLNRTEEDLRYNYNLWPASVYGWTKLQQERTFRFYCGNLDIQCIALRYSIILGAGQSLDSSESGVLRNWLRCAIAAKRPEIYGDGSQVRDFVHIEDVTAANLAAIESKFDGALNISGPQMRIDTLAALFHMIVGDPEPTILNKNIRPGGEYSMTSNCLDAYHHLHWSAEKGVETMVRDFIEFSMRRIQNEKA